MFPKYAPAKVKASSAGTDVWEATGARTVEVSAVFQDLADAPREREPGATWIRLIVEVYPSGESSLARVSFDAPARDGNGLGHGGTYAVHDTRLTGESTPVFT